MKVACLKVPELKERLSGVGLYLKTGPFIVRLQGQIGTLPQIIRLLYADFPVAKGEVIADFHISLRKPGNLRYWWRPQVLFQIDGRIPFEPFPLKLATPLLEWGMNWCIATRAHHYLMLHAGIVEKNGQGIILPAYPGSGKSTLCAALIHRGWRLLSDEFGLVNMEDGRIVPLPRPISLKNQSIAVIREFAPDAVIGPSFPKTRKGTVAHLRPPTSSVERMEETVSPSLVIFPRYKTGAPTVLESYSQAYAFLKLANNAFNYEVLGVNGFKLVTKMIRSCQCYALSFGDLDEAIAKLDALVAPSYAG
ncbi:HprK-related kinase A [Nitrosococcus wardiae]|uniref:HprK-related kinase A n=1 Tax=Nitrosococcus wardiae TaxID=1814290 RepID=A0A4V1AVW1_9GAMM|nr:HprK-related kinase A [Nitrosococcus wardiae]QBQ54515.1 HprK-related kinase A [Nitrosococcus wardiae]